MFEGLPIEFGLWLNDFGKGSRKEAGLYSGLDSVRDNSDWVS